MNQAGGSADDFLALSPRIRVMPIIHGSGDFAVAVRDELLKRPYDCVAVPLPPSFQDEVESAVARLPEIGVVVERDGENEEGEPGFSYVPIDPCQGVIAALRVAAEERLDRAFIDMETAGFVAVAGSFPDPYALKRVSPDRFAAALLPAIPPPPHEQTRNRIAWMADQLRRLETRHKLTLFVCSILDWPWVKDAYSRALPPPEPEPADERAVAFGVDPRTLIFVLGELPFITGLYERGRRELEPDDNLSIDGVKELVLEARTRLKTTHPRVAQRLTPQTLSIYFRYVRNLALVEGRLTPDFYTIVKAAQQTAGDEFALAVAETARTYPFAPAEPDHAGESAGLARFGVDRASIPLLGTGPMVCRLPGQSVTWRSTELRPKPPKAQERRWRQRWNPFGMCSWPPEDDRIEGFQRHVRDQAKQVMGLDLARSEKFTTSVRDGIDVRETLRNWHTGDLYVKVVPPSRGSIEVVVFLFETPADPSVYTNRTTWYAEHENESTLAFYATNPFEKLIGPGIAQAEYGGAMFLFPPRPIEDVWTDKALDFTDTLEERLLAAAFAHSRERHVALASPIPPLATWRRLARRFGRKIVHLPLKRFSGSLIEQMRTFHVLNGKHVRSYAADFIRDH